MPLHLLPDIAYRKIVDHLDANERCRLTEASSWLLNIIWDVGDKHLNLKWKEECNGIGLIGLLGRWRKSLVEVSIKDPTVLPFLAMALCLSQSFRPFLACPLL